MAPSTECEVCGGDGFHCHVKTVSVSPRAMPTRRKTTPRSEAARQRKVNANAWERGVVTETLPNGERTPLLDDNLQPIGLAKWQDEPKWRQRKQRLDAEIAANRK